MVSLNILVTVPSNSFQFFWWFGGKNVILQAKHLKCKYSKIIWKQELKIWMPRLVAVVW